MLRLTASAYPDGVLVFKRHPHLAQASAWSSPFKSIGDGITEFEFSSLSWILPPLPILGARQEIHPTFVEERRRRDAAPSTTTSRQVRTRPRR